MQEHITIKCTQIHYPIKINACRALNALNVRKFGYRNARNACRGRQEMPVPKASNRQTNTIPGGQCTVILGALTKHHHDEPRSGIHQLQISGAHLAQCWWPNACAPSPASWWLLPPPSRPSRWLSLMPPHTTQALMLYHHTHPHAAMQNSQATAQQLTVGNHMKPPAGEVREGS